MTARERPGVDEEISIMSRSSTGKEVIKKSRFPELDQESFTSSTEEMF